MTSGTTSRLPVRPRIWPLILAYLFIWGFLFVPVFAGAVYWGFRFAIETGPGAADVPPDELAARFEAGFMEMMEGAGFLAASVIAMGSFMLVLAVLAATASPVPFARRLRLGRGSHAGAGAWIAGILFCYAVGYLSSVAVVGAWGGLSEQLLAIEETIIAASGAPLLWITMGIAVAAPLGEEFMFRGYIQSRLVERFGVAWGVAIASIAFGVLHLDVQHVLAAIPMGVALGIVAVRTGSIVPCILAHAFNNGLYIVTARLWPTESVLDHLALWLGISLVASAATGVWFIRATRPRPAEPTGGVEADAREAAAGPPP